MDKKNKGLVDNHDGDIILNESGTSVSFGWDTGEENKEKEETSQQEDKEDDKPEPPGNTDSRCIS
jgi:hypothetical protein